MKIETSRVINFILAGFFVGITLYSFFKISDTIIFCLALLPIVFLIAIYFNAKLRTNLFIYSLVLIIGFIFGLLRYSLNTNTVSPLKDFVSKNSVAEIMVARDPVDRGNQVTFDAKVLKINSLTIEDDSLIRIKVFTPEKIKYCDVLFLTGRIEYPETFETSVGRVFDYPKYLQARGVEYVMNNPKFNIVGDGEGSIVMRKLFSFKHSFTEALSRVVGEPERSLSAGMLIGEQSGLSKELSDAMRRAGLVHIVVLSGFNISIIAIGVMFLFGWASRSVRLLAGATASILFVLMSGAESASVRAGVMILIGLFAQAIYRPRDVMRALVMAGSVMVLINPKILVFDISFQLSFLATLGLFVGTPIISKYLSFITEWGKIREIVSATLSTQIAVSPLILYTMGSSRSWHFLPI